MIVARAVLWVTTSGWTPQLRMQNTVISYELDAGFNPPEDACRLQSWLSSGWRIDTATASCRSATDLIILKRELG